MAEMMDRTSRIQQKLTRLRSIDREQRIFGADYHQYELAPPTSEQQIRLFESTHGIELPEDYRAFLTEIGNGGAGPYYGLLPLDNTISEWSLREDAQYLSKPFPLPDGTDNLWQGTLRICEFGCAIEFLLVVTGSERGHVWVDDSPHAGIFPLCSRHDRKLHVDFLTWYENWLDDSLLEITEGRSDDESEYGGYFQYG